MLPSPSDDRVGDLSSWFSKLNTMPVAAPVYASDRTSRCVPQDSGSGWIRCSFPVGLFHSLLHAGLSRRTVCPTLLVAEHLARIEAGGPSRGQEGGGSADGGEKRSGGRKGERVGGLNAEQDGFHGAGAGERGGETDRQTERDQDERIAQDHPYHLSARCAERDPQTDFAGAPSGTVGDHAVE